MTNITLYSKECTKIIDLFGWAFQFLSEGGDYKAATFLVKGYEKVDIKGAVNLVSSKKIKYLWDYKFFIAITNNDVYVSRV